MLTAYVDRHVGSNVDWACCESGAYMQITPSPPRRAPPSALAAEGAGEGRRHAPAHGGGWGAEGHRRSSGGRWRSGEGRRTPCLALAGPAAAQLRGPGAAPRDPLWSSMGERERRGGRGGGGEAAVGACGRVTRQAHGPPICERKREERCHVGWVTWTKTGSFRFEGVICTVFLRVEGVGCPVL